MELCLRMPSEWLEACSDAAMRQEFDALASFVEHIDSTFHSLLVRKRSLWRGKPIAEAVQASEVYEQFAHLAVAEPVVAGAESPVDLSPAEQRPYRQLLEAPRGRLEQEFLPEDLCRATIQNWAGDC
ncbi:MAG TPA: hypothetical protein VFW87_05050 [Pirellulales bacterium]|nr:hypothetical protein [Pirellulales bacterium]